MKKQTHENQSIDEAIAAHPVPVQKKLKEIRALVKKLVPMAEEKISYRMPAFFLNGPIVYYTGYAHHIGFYPTGSGIAAFKDQLTKYKFSKGAIQFPIDKPLPKALIVKIIKFKVSENLSKIKKKK